MPAIFFDLPYQSSQQGPTCWYYAMKSIMKFHGLIGDAGALNDEWRQLHRLRQTLTALRSNGTEETVANAYKHLKARLDALQAKTQGTLSADEKVELTELVGAEVVMRKVKSTHRFELLQAFLGTGFVRQVPIDPWNASGVQAALAANGPFYVAIDQSPQSTQPVEDGFLGITISGIGRNSFTGGKHAMVFQGADDREVNGLVYLRDPKYGTTINRAPVTATLNNLNTPPGFFGATVGIAVSCVATGSCAHLQQKRTAA